LARPNSWASVAGQDLPRRDRLEAGAREVERHERDVVDVPGLPDRHRLGGKTAVREGHHEGRAGLQHAQHLTHRRDRLLEVLHRHADGGAVETAVLERQRGQAVQVLHDAAAQARVGLEFRPVHAEADDATIDDVVGQVADPARHEVEQDVARREALAIDVGDGGDRAIVDVGDEPRLRVEQQIGRGVAFGEGLGGQFGKVAHAGATDRVPRCSMGESS